MSEVQILSGPQFIIPACPDFIMLIDDELKRTIESQYGPIRSESQKRIYIETQIRRDSHGATVAVPLGVFQEASRILEDVGLEKVEVNGLTVPVTGFCPFSPKARLIHKTAREIIRSEYFATRNQILSAEKNYQL